VRQQNRARWSQPHLARISFQQLEPELAFKRLDPLRERRLGDVEALGRASEMA
jgi:hypothetical protein